MNNLPQQLEKMNELNHLPGFRHDAKLIEETGKFDHSKKEKKKGLSPFQYFAEQWIIFAEKRPHWEKGFPFERFANYEVLQLTAK